MSYTARCFAFTVVITRTAGHTLPIRQLPVQLVAASSLLQFCHISPPASFTYGLAALLHGQQCDMRSFVLLGSLVLPGFTDLPACNRHPQDTLPSIPLGSSVLPEASQTCLLATGTQKKLCPVDQPCACPTKRTGLNAFECYDPTIQSCSDTAPTWPDTGKINGPGQSDQGACPCKAHRPFLLVLLSRLCLLAAAVNSSLRIGHGTVQRLWHGGSSQKPCALPFQTLICLNPSLAALLLANMLSHA